MFELEEYIEDGPGRKVGWMTGFTWERNRLFPYKAYDQIWQSTDPPIFRDLLNNFEKTRSYPQHLYPQIAQLIVELIYFGLGLTIVILFFKLILNDGDVEQSFANNLIGILLTLGFMFLFNYFCVPYIIEYAQRNIRWKLLALMEDLSEKYKNKGYEIRFPKYVKKWCICVTCCWLYDGYDLKSVEIWDYNYGTANPANKNAALPQATNNRQSTNQPSRPNRQSTNQPNRQSLKNESSQAIIKQKIEDDQ